ncbi:MAG TPA: DUF3090 family protein, partial [Microlunatus sp.]
QQVSVLAEHLERVLEEVRRRSSGQAAVPPPVDQATDISPLDAPISEDFRVGTMTIAWDPSVNKVVIELFSNVDAGEEAEVAETDDPPALPQADEEIDADEMIVVKISPAYARDFIARAQALVAAGRPVCPFCLQPIDADGHICPRANGYRRPLF